MYSVNIVDAEGLVLKHQTISCHNGDLYENIPPEYPVVNELKQSVHAGSHRALS